MKSTFKRVRGEGMGIGDEIDTIGPGGGGGGIGHIEADSGLDGHISPVDTHL